MLTTVEITVTLHRIHLTTVLRTLLRIVHRILLRTAHRTHLRIVLRIHLRTATTRIRISKLEKIRIPFEGYPYLHNGKYRVYCWGNTNMYEDDYEKV